MNAADCSCRVTTSSMLDLRSDSDDVQVLLARDAEDALDALVLQRGDEQIGSLAHNGSLSVVGAVRRDLSAHPRHNGASQRLSPVRVSRVRDREHNARNSDNRHRLGAEDLVEAAVAEGLARTRIHQAAPRAADALRVLRALSRPGDVILLKDWREARPAGPGTPGPTSGLRPSPVNS